jgi:hypothetical protein
MVESYWSHTSQSFSKMKDTNTIRGEIDKNLRKIICPKINFEVWKL